MALYIDLDKIEHNDEIVRYKYYTSHDNVGIIELNLKTEKFNEIQAAPNDPDGILFDRAAMKIVKHWKKGTFPDKTCWAS